MSLTLALANNPLQGGGLIGALTRASQRKMTFDLINAATLSFVLPGRDPSASQVVEGITDVVAWYGDSQVPLARFRVVGSQIALKGRDADVTYSCIGYRGLCDPWLMHDGDQRSWGISVPALDGLLVEATGTGTVGAGTFSYVVTAITTTGETTASNEQSVTTTGTTNTVHLLWTPVPGATGYKIYRTAVNGANGSETLFDVVGTSTLYYDRGQAFWTGAGAGSSPPATSLLGGVLQSQVMWQIFNDGQTKPGGNLGVQQGTVTLNHPATPEPYITRPATLAVDQDHRETPNGTTGWPGIVTDFFPAGSTRLSAIQQIEQSKGGFEWDIVPHPTDLTKQVFQTWDVRGRLDPLTVMPLVVGSTVASATRQTDVLTYANVARTQGGTPTGGHQDKPPVSYQPGEDPALVGGVVPPEGRWEREYTSSATTAAGVLADCQANYSLHQADLAPAWTLVLTQGRWAGPNDLWLGDTARLLAYVGSGVPGSTPLLNVDDTLRVLKLDLAADEAGGTTITVYAGRAPNTYLLHRQRVDRRLAALELRRH